MTFWNVALWIYEFSAILSTLLLVKLTFDIKKRACEALKINSKKISVLNTIFSIFIENFFHILTPLWNTFVVFILICVYCIGDEDFWANAIQNGVEKAKRERGLSDEEFENLLDKFRDENKEESEEQNL